MMSMSCFFDFTKIPQIKISRSKYGKSITFQLKGTKRQDENAILGLGISGQTFFKFNLEDELQLINTYKIEM